MTADIFLDDLHQAFALGSIEVCPGNSLGFGVVPPWYVEDLLWRFGQDDCFLFLIVRQALHERASKFFFLTKNSSAGTSAFLHFARVRSKKTRRHDWRRSAGGGEIQRQVMPLDAPSPRLNARRTKNRDEVLLGITHRSA
jgi:hypothetical protein